MLNSWVALRRRTTKIRANRTAIESIWVDCVYSENVFASRKAYIELQLRDRMSTKKPQKIFRLNGYDWCTKSGAMPIAAKFFWVNSRIWIFCIFGSIGLEFSIALQLIFWLLLVISMTKRTKLIDSAKAYRLATNDFQNELQTNWRNHLWMFFFLFVNSMKYQTYKIFILIQYACLYRQTCR